MPQRPIVYNIVSNNNINIITTKQHQILCVDSKWLPHYINDL